MAEKDCIVQWMCINKKSKLVDHLMFVEIHLKLSSLYFQSINFFNLYCYLFGAALSQLNFFYLYCYLFGAAFLFLKIFQCCLARSNSFPYCLSMKNSKSTSGLVMSGYASLRHEQA